MLKFKPISLFQIVLIVLLVQACGQKESNISSKSSDTIILKQLVADWNKAHQSKDVAIFSSLFNNTVLFYGSQQDKNACIENKLKFFKKNPDFYQQILGSIQIDKISENEIKCSFIKRVTVNKKNDDYPSYLIFKESDGNWKIITEGDLVTDKNIANRAKKDLPADKIKGDFNGDGQQEYMWLDKPKILDSYACDGPCSCTIRFSNSKIPAINIDNCIGGIPVNEGDLNGDGSDEIGLLPEWFSSCWSAYYVWTYKSNNFVFAIPSLSTHCAQWEEDVDAVSIDKTKKGYVITKESEINDDGNFVIKTQSVEIVK